MKKVLEWTSWGILILAVSVLCVVLVSSKMGWEYDAVLSGSMEPTLHVGGLVVMQPIKAEDVKVGDIITFRISGTDTPVCHRAIEIMAENGVISIRTKGDNNESPDPWLVMADAVKGREVLTLPYVGYLTYFERFAKTQVTIMGREFASGFIAMLILGSTVIGLIVSELWFSVTDPVNTKRGHAIEARRKKLLARRKSLMKVKR